MRIAMVSPGYPPAPGGVETVVAQTARALARAGVLVEVLAQEPRRDLPAVRVEDGVVVRRFRSNRAGTYRVSPGLYRYLARHHGGFDVVHGHSYHALTGVAAGLALRAGRRRTPYVVTPHYHGTGHTVVRAALHRAYAPLGRAAMEASHAVVCVSRPEADLVSAHFPKAAGKISVIPNAVDRAVLRSALPLEGQPPTILSVGRLEPYKRVDRLIAAFAALADRGSPGQLVVIGAGPDRSRLEELARRSGHAGRVRFLGRVDDGELRRWLRTAAVLCSLSEHEAYGLAPAEALVAGARVVLSDIPAHRELATADAARLVGGARGGALGDGELTGALTAALTDGRASSDPAILTWEDVAEQLIDIYRRTGSAGRGRTA